MKQKPFLTILLIGVGLTMSLVSYSQTYEYSYDNSGNRIKRQVVQLKNATIAPSNDFDQKILDEKLGERTIKVYPNPTKGQLKVEISDLEQSSKIQIHVLNLSGLLVENQNVTSTLTVINLHNQPAGAYIMRIISGQSISEWKIIKE